jgi:hypothetical protein
MQNAHAKAAAGERMAYLSGSGDAGVPTSE